MTDVRGVNEHCRWLQACDFTHELPCIFLGACGVIGENPIVASTFDSHRERVRFELRHKVNRPTTALHRSGKRRATGKAFISRSRRGIDAQNDRFATHSLFLPCAGFLPAPGRSAKLCSQAHGVPAGALTRIVSATNRRGFSRAQPPAQICLRRQVKAERVREGR